MPAPPTAFKPPTMIFQSGSATLLPSVPTSERPSKALVSQYSTTPGHTPRVSRPSSLTPAHPLPPVTPPMITSHLRPISTDPDMAPPPFFTSYPSRGATVPTPLSTLPYHPGPLLSQVQRQSPGMLSSKGQWMEGPVSATAKTARHTTNQTVPGTVNTNIRPPNSLAGAKRRLGMGHSSAGYVSKKRRSGIDGVYAET